MGEKKGVRAGVILVPAVTNSFMWLVNSKRGEEGERVTREEGDLDGVWRVERSESSQTLVLVRGLEEGGDSSSRL